MFADCSLLNINTTLQKVKECKTELERNMDPQQQRTLLIFSAICLLMGETITMCAILMQLLVLKQHHHSQMVQNILELDLKVVKLRLLERQRKILKKKIKRKMRKKIRKRVRKMWGKYMDKLDSL